jgi:CBS-domain-containing membrane protein
MAWGFFLILIAFFPLTAIDNFVLDKHHRYRWHLFSAPFGSGMLVFGRPHSVFSQPPNVILGNMVAAACGVVARNLGGWVAPCLAIPFAMFFMEISRSVHPPAGGHALAAAIYAGPVASLGWNFVLATGVCSAWLVLVGVVFHNLPNDKSLRYPMYWWCF